RPPRRALERPARRPERGLDLRRQLPRHAAPRARREGGRRLALRLLLVVQHVRRLRPRRRARRGRAAQAAHAVRGVEGALRGGPRRARRLWLLPRLAPQRDRVRGLAAPPARRRAQQPRRLGVHDRPDPAPLRRELVAADRPHPRLRPRRPRRARGAARDDPRAGPQRRSLARELPDPRPGGPRPRGAPRVRGRAGEWGRRRPAQLPRRLPPLRARVPRPPARVGRAARDGRARRRLPRGRAHVGGLRRAAVHAAQAPPAPARGGAPRRRPALARGGVIVAETALPGVYTLEIEPHADERGFFARVWDGELLAAAGLDARVSQSSIAFNHRAGTLRGLHFQRPPHAETKLV